MAKKNESIESAPSFIVLSWDDFNSAAPELCKPEAVNLVDTLEGTWAKEEGAIIVGEVSHLYTWTPKDDDGYERGDEEGGSAVMVGVCLIVRTPTLCRTDRGKEMVPAGSKVGVTLAKKLRGIQYQRPGDVVGIQAVRLVDLGKKSVWEYRVRASAAARPEPMVIPELPF